jgi:hypothetical protein
MDILRQAIAVLCLILMVWVLFSPVLGSDAAPFVLPVAGFLQLLLLSLSVLLFADGSNPSEPRFGFASLRAPPQQ